MYNCQKPSDFENRYAEIPGRLFLSQFLFICLCPWKKLYSKSTLVEIIFLEGRRKVKEKKKIGTQMAAPLTLIV